MHAPAARPPPGGRLQRRGAAAAILSQGRCRAFACVATEARPAAQEQQHTAPAGAARACDGARPRRLAVVVRDAAGDPGLQAACAALRASVFYPPPAVEARLRMELVRAPRLTALGMRVSTLAAVVLDDDDDADGHGDDGGGRAPVVAGTLDVHVGDALPGEPLAGALPRVGAVEAGEGSSGVASGAQSPPPPPLPFWLQAGGGVPPAGAASSSAAASLGARASYAAGGRAAAGADEPAAVPFVLPPGHAARPALRPRIPPRPSAFPWLPPPPPPPAPPAPSALAGADDGDADCDDGDDDGGRLRLRRAAAASAALSAACRPSGGATAGARAYVFNVCVAPRSRRRGVATALLQAAAAAAAAAGVTHLYLHAETGDAGGALRLYAGLGWAPEAAEPEWLAERLGRPARVLLVRPLEGVTS